MKIDGREIANKILLGLKKRVEKLKAKNIIPHLTVILISNDPSSVSYVNQKKIKGKSIGAKISVKVLSSDVNEPKLLTTIEQLNNKTNVHGTIVQRPLPASIDTNEISLAIDPRKDVDGFQPNSKFQPPLALAVLRILERVYRDSPRRNPSATSEVARQRPRLLGGGFLKWLRSKKILILGKGETGGKPIIDTFRKMGIDPTIIDSKAPNPQNIVKKADIVISAVGKPNVIKTELLKKGVILIGVGLSKGKDRKMHGDYDEEKVKNIASFYTPTPGGVGPVNVAMLLQNLLTAAENSK